MNMKRAYELHAIDKDNELAAKNFKHFYLLILFTDFLLSKLAILGVIIRSNCMFSRRCNF